MDSYQRLRGEYEEGLRRSAEKGGTVKKDASGVVVGWFLPESVARGFALEGGEPADRLHLTFCFLGSEDQVDVETVMEVVQDVAETWGPLTIEVSGTARFLAKEGRKDPFVLLFDTPELERLREEIAEGLDAAGIAPSQEYAYTPHVTLQYLARGSATPELRVGRQQVLLDALTVAVGDDHVSFPLEQPDMSGYEKSAKTVGPHARFKLRHLLAYYAKKPHPFRACVRDNRKRFGPGTEAICATLKDLIEGNPYWRNKPGPGR